MKPGMLRAVAPGRPDRAGQARKTANVHARSGFILHCSNVADAAVDIVASRRKGVHGAVRQAWPIHTSLARMRLFPPRQHDRLAQKDSRAIGVPQAELRMDLDPDGRGTYAVRPLRPALERPIGRPGEREQHEAADR